MVASSDKPGNLGAENLESRQISPLGQAIRYLREDQRLTQEALADLAKVDKQRISDIERGETRSLHAPTVKKICDGLAISLEELRAKEREFSKVADTGGAQRTESHSNSPPAALVHNDIRPVPGFTGREELLAGIDAALWRQGGTAALTNGATSAAVKGLGGVGKSALAREYAWRMRGKYHGVWWVRGESEQTLIDDLIDLGSRLIPNLREVQERDRALLLALDAIAAAGGDRPWLIVYDNVEKPGAIARVTPKTSTHILITSRWPRWQGHAQELPVDVFPEATAVDFLLAERPHEIREAAGRLAAALGRLPLALSHARAYCAETNLSFDDYARRLCELIQDAPEDAEYPASVFATFSLAIAKAAEACPEAEKLMEIAAFLAPERIPLDIITDDVMSEKQRENAAASLYKMSLISHDMLSDGSRAFSLHRLVQLVVLQRLDQRADAAARVALNLLDVALPQGTSIGEPSEWPRVERLLPHTLAILERLPAERESANAHAYLSNLIGYYLHARGAYSEAEHLFRHAMTIWEQTRGLDHPYMNSILNNIGDCLRYQGKYDEAAAFFEQALDVAEASLGAENAATIVTLNNLAGIHTAKGNYAKAEGIYQRAIELAQIALGVDHPTTAMILNNFAELRRQEVRHDDLEPLYIRALESLIAALGKNHPDTGVAVNNLALLYRVQGRFAEAEPLFEWTLDIALNVLGKSHPETGKRCHNLASLYALQGRYEDAEALFLAALGIAEFSFGKEHSAIALSLSGLADLHRLQHRYGEAELLFKNALQISEITLGIEHPSTINTLYNLAQTVCEQGRFDEAEPIFLAAISGFEKSLGVDHVSTITTKTTYARIKNSIRDNGTAN